MQNTLNVPTPIHLAPRRSTRSRSRSLSPTRSRLGREPGLAYNIPQRDWTKLKEDLQFQAAGLLMARSQLEALEWRLSAQLVELEEACPVHTSASRQVGEIHGYTEGAFLELSQTLRRLAQRVQLTRDFLSDISQERTI